MKDTILNTALIVATFIGIMAVAFQDREAPYHPVSADAGTVRSMEKTIVVGKTGRVEPTIAAVKVD